MVEWTRRECNREAHLFACGDFTGFNPDQRINVNPEEIYWIVLPNALAAGREVEARARKQKKRKPEDKLRNVNREMEKSGTSVIPLRLASFVGCRCLSHCDFDGRTTSVLLNSTTDQRQV